MPWIEFGGRRIEVSDAGYIVNPDDWTPELAEALALSDGLNLTEAHWQVITFLRNYFGKYRIAPMIRILGREIAKIMGPEKGDTVYLYRLFPEGPAKQACRYAGLPKPTGCV